MNTRHQFDKKYKNSTEVFINSLKNYHNTDVAYHIVVNLVAPPSINPNLITISTKRYSFHFCQRFVSYFFSLRKIRGSTIFSVDPFVFILKDLGYKFFTRCSYILSCTRTHTVYSFTLVWLFVYKSAIVIDDSIKVFSYKTSLCFYL